MIHFKKIYLPILFFISFFILWETISKNSALLTFILPPPSYVLENLLKNYHRFAFHSWITFKEMVGGIAIAFSFAFPLAWMMYFSRNARYILQPIFLIIQCIPMFTLAPIMVIWFGWSYISIVIPTALMIFFPLTINIFQGLKSTPKEYIEYFKVNHATPWQMFTQLQLPWAFPQICAGLRISAAIAGIGAVAGEWAGGQNGLGILMLESRRSADLVTCFAALLCLTLLSLSFYFVVLYFEKISLKKRKSFNTLGIAFIALFAILLIPLIGFKTVKKEASYSLVLDWLPNPDHIPIYVGVEKGIFKKNGIDIEIRKVPDPSDPIAYLTSKQVDLAVYYLPDTIQAVERGAPFKTIGKLMDKPLRGLIFRKDSNIHETKDLNQKLAGYCVDGSCIKFLKAILEENDVAVKDFVNISYDLITALANNQVDFTYGAFWNIECEQLNSLGIETSYFSIENLGVPSYSELIFIVNKGSTFDEEINKNNFQIAIQESIDFCRADPKKAFELYLKANPDKNEFTQNWEWKAWLKTIPLLANDQKVSVEEWDRLKTWLKKKNVISLEG